MHLLTAVTLYIVLIAPNGAVSESRIDLDRATCRTQKALTHAAMLSNPRGWTLVSVDCLPVAVAK